MMRISSYSFNFVILIIISLSAFSCITHSSGQLISDLACKLVNCGEGKCVYSNETLLGFDCDCNSGWKKIQIGPLTFPSCVVPNCTLDFQCGNGAPPPPPPPPATLPPLNITNPCNLVWCGDGACVANGTGYNCECYEGSYNLFNKFDLACFKQCYMGGDCKGLGLVQQPPPSSPSSSGSPRLGSKRPNEAPSCFRNLHLLISILVFSATLLAWF